MRLSRSIPTFVLIGGVFAAAPRAEAAFTRGPWIQDAQTASITVEWEAGAAGGTQKLMWGVGTALDQSKDATLVAGSIYKATLTGLTQSTGYSYKVMSGADSSAPSTFSTAPDHAEPFRFVAYGDNRTDATAHASVIAGVAAKSPDFVINTGDLSDTGNYIQFMQIESPVISKVPIFPTPGNHDGSGTAYTQGLDRPLWYSYKWGNAFFIAISADGSDSYAQGSTQYNWVESQLQAAKADSSIQFIFAYHHYPVYSSSTHGSTSDQLTSLNVLYKQYGVDIVFNGHDHDYERSEADNIVYIVAGGGGAPLYGAGSSCTGHVISESVNSFVTVDVDGGKLHLQAWRADGTMIDERSLDKGAASGNPTPTPNPTGTPGDPGNPGGNGDNGSVHGGAMCDVHGVNGSAGSALGGLLAAGAIVAIVARKRR